MQFKATFVRTVLGTLLVHGQHYVFSFLSAMATGSIGPCVWQKKKKKKIIPTVILCLKASYFVKA